MQSAAALHRRRRAPRPRSTASAAGSGDEGARGRCRSWAGRCRSGGRRGLRSATGSRLLSRAACETSTSSTSCSADRPQLRRRWPHLLRDHEARAPADAATKVALPATGSSTSRWERSPRAASRACRARQPVSSTAVRSRRLAAAPLGCVQRRRRCSLAHVVGDDIAVVVNGRAVIIERGDQARGARSDRDRDLRLEPFSWGDGAVFIRVEPDVMFTYAFHPENFPHLDD